MIEDVLLLCDYNLNGNGDYKNAMTLGELKDVRKIARQITNAENEIVSTENAQLNTDKKIPVLGITGTGGAGKSSVTDEIVRRFLGRVPSRTCSNEAMV